MRRSCIGFSRATSLAAIHWAVFAALYAVYPAQRRASAGECDAPNADRHRTATSTPSMPDVKRPIPTWAGSSPDYGVNTAHDGERDRECVPTHADGDDGVTDTPSEPARIRSSAPSAAQAALRASPSGTRSAGASAAATDSAGAARPAASARTPSSSRHADGSTTRSRPKRAASSSLRSACPT
jgi:hypothetical protein